MIVPDLIGMEILHVKNILRDSIAVVTVLNEKKENRTWKLKLTSMMGRNDKRFGPNKNQKEICRNDKYI